jgi:tRNA A-37 threonylcarbamoyl transferase component Bud32/TolB-like protein
LTSDLRAHLQATLGDAFTLEREIGGGGMSRVYLAEETALRRRIVVKVLPQEMAAEVSLARFQREIALAARLQHPHIVPMLASGETDGLPYYTMPFIDGESLRERLVRGGELPVVEATRLVREIASALAYAHEKGIVHRDIKPENVLLSGGIALVADFGVAKALLASASSATGPLTSAGIAVGTPAYMSPEQVTADPTVDHRADLYALGMVAYEMLAGQTPFAGRSAQALLSAHVVDAPEPLERRRPAVPPALASVVMRCLEKRPADRPQSATEIIQALDALTTPSQTAVRPVTRRRAPRSMVAIAALLIVAVAGGGAWWVFGRRAAVSTPAVSRLLIAPFENLTGDSKLDHIGRMVADQLALAVAQGSSMDVVPSNIVIMALRDTVGGYADRIRRLSEATHASFLASGSIVRRGDSLAVQGQVTEVRTNRVFLVLDPVAAVAADPGAAVRALSDRLVGGLAGRELTILSQRGYRPPTNAAYQEFAKGFERFAAYGDVMGSRPFFERAIALDPTYVRAYQLLGRQYLNAGEFARADSMVEKIEKLPQGLSAPERLQLDYMRAELNGDIPGLLKAQRHLVAVDSNPLALELVGEAAVWMLRPDLAVPSLERAGPAYLLMSGGAARFHIDRITDAYHLAGAHDRELRVLLDQTAASDPEFVRGKQLLAYAGFAKGGRLALAVADSMVRGNSDSTGTVVLRIERGAQEFRSHGDSTTASQLRDLARRWMSAHPARSPTPDRQSWEAVTFFAGGMLDSATVRFSSVARNPSRLEAAGYLALIAVARGDRVRARAIADSLGTLQRRWLFGEHVFWRAAIMGALGERALAVELLQQAHREGQPMNTWHAHPALAALRGDAGFEALVRPKR